MMMLVTLHKQTTEQKMVMEMEVEKREEIQKMSRINIYITHIYQTHCVCVHHFWSFHW